VLTEPVCVLWLGIAPNASAADPEIDQLLRSPVGKDWVTNGGNLKNQCYSTLKQINTENAGQLKGTWMTHLKGSGLGGKYSAEATPLVRNGKMYVVTGNDDVFALDAKTGEFLWERWSHIDQAINTVCCGWLNRGLAMGEGMLFLGQLDTNVVALDINTGKEIWKTPIEDWHNGYVATSAPLYYDGIVYSGIAGGEFGTRGRLTALDAKTGKILWRSFTLPTPGEVGSETWPKDSTQAMHGGAPIWNTPAVDPDLGLLYFAVGNCGPDYDGASREGDNLFCSSIMAIDAKTGKYAWHLQEVHHDVWDYDAASPVVLFDTVINGQPRKGIAEAGRTGWVYILDRTTGKPLIGIEEKPVPQEPRNHTAATQPYPIGDNTVPTCAPPLPGFDTPGCIFQSFWETPSLSNPVARAAPTGHRCPTVRTPDYSMCPAPSVPARSPATAATTRTANVTSGEPNRHQSARNSAAPLPRLTATPTKLRGNNKCLIAWAAAGRAGRQLCRAECQIWRSSLEVPNWFCRRRTTVRL
jgi:quinohemoprotein ethanol dehydrogenase